MTPLPRLLSPVAPILVVALLTGPGFDGCGSSPPSGPIPPGSAIACFGDGDCTSSGCEDVRCVAGECSVVAPFRDGDFDGVGPPPCGEDCDDTDALVAPGQAELCDGRDQDCDGRIDEMAPPSVQRTLLATATDEIAVAAIADVMVLTDTPSTGGLRLRTADFEGRVSPPTPVTSDAVLFAALASTEAGAVLAVARARDTDAVVEAYALTMDGSTLRVGTVTTVATTTMDARPDALRVAALGSSFVVVWDDLVLDRWMASPSWAAPMPIATGIAALAPLAVASVGSSLVVPTQDRELTFFAAADGAVLATVSTPSTLAAGPLAAGTTDYLVAYHDAFDHQIAHVSATGLGTPHGAPSQGTGLPLRLDASPLGAIVTRFDATNSRGQGAGALVLVLSESLDSVRAEFPPSMVSGGLAGTPSAYAVVTGDGGTAVLTNYGLPGAVLASLGCQAP
ncbi:MAG: putative metal-binding motif-containing protein [Sandaracinus sp.]